MTPLAVWLVLAVLAGSGVLVLGARLTRDRVTEVLAIHEREEAAIRDGLEADITGDTDKKRALYGPDWPGAWPEDFCAYPPCDREDRWECASHQPRGKHHRLSIVHTPPYDDPPTDVISIAEWQARVALEDTP